MTLIGSGQARAGSHGGGIKGGMLLSDPVGDQETYNVESVRTFTYGAFYRILNRALDSLP